MWSFLVKQRFTYADQSDPGVIITSKFLPFMIVMISCCSALPVFMKSMSHVSSPRAHVAAKASKLRMRVFILVRFLFG